MTTKQKQAHTPAPLTYEWDDYSGKNWLVAIADFGADGKAYITTDRVPASAARLGDPEADVRLWAASPAMLAAANTLYDWLLRAMTEDNLDERDEATCPICHLPEPGNFDSIHEDDHHDGCPWPQFLRARSLAQDV